MVKPQKQQPIHRSKRFWKERKKCQHLFLVAQDHAEYFEEI